jgi:hypothetical protein
MIAAGEILLERRKDRGNDLLARRQYTVASALRLAYAVNVTVSRPCKIVDMPTSKTGKLVTRIKNPGPGDQVEVIRKEE